MAIPEKDDPHVLLEGVGHRFADGTDALGQVDLAINRGDFVAILDYDHSYGYAYRQGAVTIGIILHGDGTAGHGPGVTTLLTSGEGNIVPVIDPNANLATRLGLRKGEKKSKRR